MSGYRMMLSTVSGAAMLLASAIATPAGADVKSGAEAWGRGDYAGAVREWEGPAAQGDPDAEFNLAQAYKLGRGVPRDMPKAELLFSKAAAQGHVAAADNYGLLLFDRGERAKALPYVRAAAERGDPRAQYLMGIAHFNGDLAPKDWVLAYALMTLAQGANLPQATPALAQMDQFIPLPQRQAAASLAAQLGQKAEASRDMQLAAADLGVRPAPPAAVGATGGASVVTAVGATAVSPPIVRPDAAVPSALRTAGGDSPATAGADYARPATPAKPAVPVVTTAPVPAPVANPAPKPALAAKPTPTLAPTQAATQAPAPRPAPSGGWRLQFGAFGVPANADALWNRLKARPEVAGHPRINARAGTVTKLQAGGYTTREAASTACASLAKAGITCIPVQD